MSSERDLLPCPRKPTTGYMRTVLERHGVHTRGVIPDKQSAKLVRMMLELGYEIDDGKRAEKPDEEDR